MTQAKGINVEEFLKRQQHEILAQEAYGNVNHQLGHRKFLTAPGSMISISVFFFDFV